ncbi:MAG: hypothetical protein IMW89_18240 [Ktedonobacteraceae bacterium]|nr:hypothetical protein [Ktedonobacteraceae bacterium]
MIVTVTGPVAKVQFALATVRLARVKVNQTIRQSIRGRGVAFDANELLVIQASVWLFAAALEEVAPSPQSERKKKLCQELCAMLTPFGLMSSE